MEQFLKTTTITEKYSIKWMIMYDFGDLGMGRIMLQRIMVELDYQF